MINIIEYDLASGDLGIRAMNEKFQAGWEILEPLKYHPCCGIFRTTLFLPAGSGLASE